MTAGFALFRLLIAVAIIAMGGVTASAMYGAPSSSVISAKAVIVAVATPGSHQESSTRDIDDHNCPPSDTQSCCHTSSSGCCSSVISAERTQSMAISAVDDGRPHPLDTAADGTDPEATKKPPKTVV